MLLFAPVLKTEYNPTCIFHNFIVILANNSKIHLIVEQHVMVEKTNLTET